MLRSNIESYFLTFVDSTPDTNSLRVVTYLARLR